MTPPSVPSQTPTQSQTHSNLFLAALPARELAALTPLLRPAELPQGQVLFEPGEIESGMISLLTPMQDGNAVETATLGREAIVGALAALGLHHVHTRAVVQIAGSGHRMRVADFRAAVDKSRLLRQLVLLSSELTLAQTQQTAACNAIHSAERRLCRWILQVRDRIDGLPRPDAGGAPPDGEPDRPPAAGRGPHPLPARARHHRRPAGAGEDGLRMRGCAAHQDAVHPGRAGLRLATSRTPPFRGLREREVPR
ncbi:MAG: Crp/Fnr family transcriptional regulator [Alphaproteobacteria bacterium]|nr:Crp/Fnr family transcriptional regulator [Alphaproteobacteria bacterium]